METVHLDLDSLAALVGRNPEMDIETGLLAHLAERCPQCAEVLRDYDELRIRFRHWDAEVFVGEGRRADADYAELTRAGTDYATQSHLLRHRDDLGSWGLAIVLLERAEEKLAQGDREPARHHALLAAEVAGGLSDAYHVEWIADLAARAYATAAAAARGKAEHRLWAAAATEALRKGTNEPAVVREVEALLG